MSTGTDGRKTANDIVLDYVARRLQTGQFTGQIILHVHDGTIRKHETRDFVTTESLLTRNGSRS